MEHLSSTFDSSSPEGDQWLAGVLRLGSLPKLTAVMRSFIPTSSGSILVFKTAPYLMIKVTQDVSHYFL